MLVECRSGHTGADFLAFLKRMAGAKRGRELHVIMDNSSTHSTPAVHARGPAALHAARRLVLHMIEAWFGILTRKFYATGSGSTRSGL